MRRAIYIAVAVVVVAANVLFFTTESGMSQQNFRSACMGDYQRHCAGVSPGGGRIVACLAQRVSELDPGCARIISVVAKCMDDYKKFCPNVTPGGGELRNCLVQHRSELSPSCAAVVARMQAN